MSEIPGYIQKLFKPRPQAKSATSRKVWGLDLETFWVPLFTATNVVNLTDMPSDALGAPLRLNKDRDGSVRFSQSGRPSYSVAKPIRDAVKVAQENFEAENLLFVANVQKAHKEEYKAEVLAYQKAGQPIKDTQAQDLADAIAQAQEIADVLSKIPTKAPEPAQTPELVAA